MSGLERFEEVKFVLGFLHFCCSTWNNEQHFFFLFSFFIIILGPFRNGVYIGF